MGFQVSPGVNVTEIDLTTIVPAVSTTNGGMAGAFQWGPANQRILVDSEDNLRDLFGEPNDDTFEYFFTAANAVDGECGDESTEGEATGEVTGVPEVNPDGDIVVAGQTTEDEDCKDEGETEARPRKIYPLEDLGFPEYEQGSAGPGPAGGNS